MEEERESRHNIYIRTNKAGLGFLFSISLYFFSFTLISLFLSFIPGLEASMISQFIVTTCDLSITSHIIHKTL